MEIKNNNTICAPDFIKKNGVSKSDNSVYSEFNGKLKNVSYTKPDNFFMKIIKKLLEFFYSLNGKISNDTSINYSENPRATLTLPISKNVADEIKNQSYDLDSPYFFGFIDPNVDTDDFSIKLITENDYDAILNAVNEGINLMYSFYNEHDRVREGLESYLQHENGAFTLKNVPQKDIAYFQKLEMINDMFIKYIKSMNTIYETNIHEDIKNVHFNDSLLNPEFTPDRIASFYKDQTMILPVFPSKDFHQQMIDKNDLSETDVYLSFIDPHSKTIESDMKLLSDSDFTMLSRTVENGLKLLVTIDNDLVDLNENIRDYYDYNNEQHQLQRVPVEHIARLAKFEMINKSFIEFTQIIKNLYSPELLASQEKNV